MKNLLVAIVVAVAAVMAGVVAYRLSADALAIIVGVLLGLLALIPALIIGVVLLRRSQPTPLPMQPAPQAPPVIVVSGGFHPAAFPQQMGMPMSQPQPPMLPAPPTSSHGSSASWAMSRPKLSTSKTRNGRPLARGARHR